MKLKNNLLYTVMIRAINGENIFLSHQILEDDMIDELIEIFNKYNAKVFFTKKQLDKIKSRTNQINFRTNISVSSLNDISDEFLNSNKNIIEIELCSRTVTNKNEYYRGHVYKIEDLLKIKDEIKKIKNEIYIPEDSDENKEKKIFMQIYNILGKIIQYDYSILLEEVRRNYNLQEDSRNLYGGLIKEKSVCEGFAIILQTVLAEFNIESKCVTALPDFSNPNRKKNLRNGHVWNCVKLDGKEYYCDLTWDAPSIKLEKWPLRFCLTSPEIFGHNSLEKQPAKDYISLEQQMIIRGFDKNEIDVFLKKRGYNYKKFIYPDFDNCQFDFIDKSISICENIQEQLDDKDSGR